MFLLRSLRRNARYRPGISLARSGVRRVCRRTNGYFNIVKQLNGGITYYTGNPPTDQLKGYNPLDFVWSLKRAQWLRQP